MHNIYHQLSPSILPILKDAGIPVVHTLHDYKLAAPNYNLLHDGKIDESSLGGKYYNIFLKKGMKNSYSASAVAMVEMYIHRWMKVYERNVDCFISPSDFLKQKIIQAGIKPKRLEVLPNFIDVDSIQPNYQHKKYFFYVGGLYKEKGVDLLIDIIDRIGYDCTLRIAGDGPERKALEEQAQGKRVTFLGHIEKSALVAQLQNSLAVVVPSRWYENYPLTVLEAFAAGKPVIAANIGGLPEMVMPGKTGWLFEPNDPEDLQRVVEHVAQQQYEAIALGKKARTWVEQHASPQVHYTKLHAIYTDYTS